jgi:hypothetical protein
MVVRLLIALAVVSVSLSLSQRASAAASAVAASSRRKLSLSAASRTARLRFLQNSNNSNVDCVATTTVDYINQVLGPSSASNSLYKTVTLDNIDALGNSLVIRIRELAQALLEDELHHGVDDSSSGVSATATSSTSNSLLSKEYIGRNGEYTADLLHQHQILTKFWGLNATGSTTADPVVLVGLHSEPLQGNLERAVAAWLQKEGQLTSNEYLQYNISSDVIATLARQVQTAIETELPYNYSNPALTFIAYYSPRFGVAGFDPDASIVALGDGYLDFYASLGLSSVGADMLHAHEFSHALHFELDLQAVSGNLTAYIANFVATRSPELDRRYELEADAMGAYALAHPYGLYWDVTRLREAAQAVYEIGDCLVTQTFHHGTPLQRQCAALWGADQAIDDDSTNGTTAQPLLSPLEIRHLFEQHLDLILALDPTVCNLTDENGRNPVVLPTAPLTVSNDPAPTPMSVSTPATASIGPSGSASWPLGIILLLSTPQELLLSLA